MRLAADGSLIACPNPSIERKPTSIGKLNDVAPAAVSPDHASTVLPIACLRFHRSAR